MPVEAIFVHVIAIAGKEPFAAECLATLVVLMQVRQGDGLTLDQQIPDFALWHVLAIIVDDANFVAGKRLATATGTDRARPVGKKSVIGLGATNGVEDL